MKSFSSRPGLPSITLRLFAFVGRAAGAAKPCREAWLVAKNVPVEVAYARKSRTCICLSPVSKKNDLFVGYLATRKGVARTHVAEERLLHLLWCHQVIARRNCAAQMSVAAGNEFKR